MSRMGNGYGSEWHLLRYLDNHRSNLNQHILDATGAITIEWLDFPISLSGDQCEWVGLDFIQNTDIKSHWRGYWPSSGSPPHWDAIGKLNKDGQEEWLLVEAKAHIGELKSYCRATSIESGGMIRKAMEATAREVTKNGVPSEAWYHEFYQHANRLAVLNFLFNTCKPVIQSRLLFLYFYGESVEKTKGRECPKNEAEWKSHLDIVYDKLDIDIQSPLMQRVQHIFLPINPQA